MNAGFTLLLSFSIGIMAGFRSLVTPAVVAWAATLKWINLQDTALSFMGTTWAVGIFTVLALVELIADKLPSTPARTSAVQLSARLVTGGLSGACLAVAGGLTLWPGALVGAIGTIAGAFGGIVFVPVWFVPCAFQISSSQLLKTWSQSDSDYYWFLGFEVRTNTKVSPLLSSNCFPSAPLL